MNKKQRHLILTRGIASIGGLLSLVLISVFLTINPVSAANEFEKFPTGEKLTYNLSFENFDNAGYAEIFIASRGMIGEKKAIEMRSRLKSQNIVSAAYFLFDRERTVFVSEDTGYPLYVKDVSKSKGLPEETISNYLTEPSTNFDLLTMLYKVREDGGAGSYSIFENGQSHSVSFATSGGETVVTDSETFETQIATVTSSYLAELGLSNVRINFSNDERKIPVRFLVETARGTFRATLASYSVLAPPPTPSPEIAATATPVIVRTPLPVATPRPYLDNQPLSPDLPFILGETLNFRITQGEVERARVRFEVARRQLINSKDKLVLRASVSDQGDASLFTDKDTVEAEVDPYSLVPSRHQTQFYSAFSPFTRESIYNQSAGIVLSGSAGRTEVPIGTHSLLSIAYAIRSFNLRPSMDRENPVNDTRVSVFLNGKGYVFILRPSEPEKVKIGSREYNAQMITILTGDPTLDLLRPKLWLSTDASRTPIKFEAGNYKAELIR